MTEPTSATTLVLAASSVGLATLVPGLDGNAIIGAFAGATLVALHSRDVSVPSRIVYLVISWIMGYLAAPMVARQTHILETGVAAFLAATVVIALAVQLIERVKSIDLTSWLRRGGPQ